MCPRPESLSGWPWEFLSCGILYCLIPWHGWCLCIMQAQETLSLSLSSLSWEGEVSLLVSSRSILLVISINTEHFLGNKWFYWFCWALSTHWWEDSWSLTLTRHKKLFTVTQNHSCGLQMFSHNLDCYMMQNTNHQSHRCGSVIQDNGLTEHFHTWEASWPAVGQKHLHGNSQGLTFSSSPARPREIWSRTAGCQRWPPRSWLCGLFASRVLGLVLEWRLLQEWGRQEKRHGG